VRIRRRLVTDREPLADGTAAMMRVELRLPGHEGDVGLHARSSAPLGLGPLLAGQRASEME